MAKTLKNQDGFGLVEALASMFILALLFTGVMIMNYSNHRAAMRITTRNEAIQIGQHILDSLKAEGLARLSVGTSIIDVDGDTSKTVGAKFKHTYRCSTLISVDGQTSEGFGTGMPVAAIERAKRVNMFVKWKLGQQNIVINLSTVVE